MARRGQSIGVGVVGCGHIAERWHIPSAMATLGVRVVAAADTQAERLRRVADRFSIPRRYPGVTELVADPEVDAVVVCVPAGQHAAVALAVLAAHKHLLVEKPLALSLEECDLMTEATDRTQAVAMVAFNLRWHRLLQRARDIIQSGKLGRVKSIRASFPCGALHPESALEWMDRRHLGGGALVETGVHDFDLFRFLLDAEIDEVFAVSRSEAIDDEAVAVAGRMDNGVILSASFAERTAGNHEIEVLGERGRLAVSCFRFDGLRWSPVGSLEGDVRSRLRAAAATLRELPRALRQRSAGGVWGESFRNQWKHFHAAITLGHPPACTLLDGRRALEVVLAAAQSASTGLPVRVAEAPQTIAAVARSE